MRKGNQLNVILYIKCNTDLSIVEVVKMKKGNHKIIFEGVELVGKSSIIHSIYNFLEKKYNSHQKILDGCHWFNSDVGIFGTKYGGEIVSRYVEMAEVMAEKNIIFEKLHLSDQAYHELYYGEKIDYSETEDKLLSLGAKIVLCAVKPDPQIFENRLNDRLSLYPHYERIVQKPEDYIKQQEVYLELSKRTKLPVLEVDLTELPNLGAEKKILEWIGEKE